MARVRPLPLLAFTCAALLVAAASNGGATTQEAAAEDDGPVLHQVAGNVKWLEGRGGNIAVQTGVDGPLVIDTQLAQDREAVVRAIRGASGAPVRFLLNTHWHGDHTGNNEPFGDEAMIVAHANVRARLAGTEGTTGRRAEDTPVAALPDVTFEDALTLHWNGERIVLEHVGPAHTDGDTVVWFHGSKVVHLGDLFFAGRFPFIDLDSGGSVRGLLEEVDALCERIDPSWTILPGHGPVGDLEDLMAYRDVLRTCIQRVAEGLEAGKDFQTLADEAPFDDFTPWGQGFMDPERFLKILVQGLSTPPGKGAPREPGR